MIHLGGKMPGTRASLPQNIGRRMNMNKTIQEIHDQYAALEKTVTLMEKNRESFRAFFQNAAPSWIIAAGCGSSFLLSESIAATASLQTGISSFAVPGGDLMLHMEQYAPLFAGKPLLLTVSRSGATSEVLYAIRELKGRYPALKTVCIACTNGSPIAAESDLVIVRSETAIQVNIAVTRAFVAVRQMIYDNSPLKRLSNLEEDFKELKSDLEEIFSDYNDINEDTRAQLDAINTTLAELQSKQKSTSRRPVGFIQPEE